MHANRASRQLLNCLRYSIVSAQCVLLLSIIFGAIGHPSLAAQETSHRKVVVRIAPEYPETLRIAQIGGLVRLSATVQPNGTVTQVDIRGGNPILAEKAQQAVMKWKYAPAGAQTVEEVSLSFSPH
jgi:TonB family protein